MEVVIEPGVREALERASRNISRAIAGSSLTMAEAAEAMQAIHRACQPRVPPKSQRLGNLLAATLRRQLSSYSRAISSRTIR